MKSGEFKDLEDLEDLEDLDEPAFERAAAFLGSLLEPGDVVVLAGEVGAGKTTFVQVAARDSLGVAERVTSPTYQIARSYDGFVDGRAVTVNHLDLYRLDEIGASDSLDLEGYLSAGSVAFIEWAEPALEALDSPSVVQIEHRSPVTRTLRVSGPLAERL